MTRRPLPVSIIGFLYIAAGVVGFAYHLTEPKAFDFEHTLVLVIRALAIVGGILVLRRVDWARWLLTVWIAYHVILSLGHSMSEVVMHIVLLAVTVYCLFNSRASTYFRRPPQEENQKTIT